MNRLDTLKETIDSYISTEMLPDQIIIVDQTSDSSLREQIKCLLNDYNSIVKLDYYYQEKPSLTKARNTGLKMCRNDVVIFSDDDITVQPSTVKNAVEIMKNLEIAMIAGINSRDGFSNSKIGYIFGKKSYKKRNIGHVTAAMYGRFPEKKIGGAHV